MALAPGGWECGRIEFAASIFTEGNPFGDSPWRHEKGGLWDVGPHALSMLIPALGEVTSVVALQGIRDQVHLALQHAEGRSSTASLSLMVPPAATGTSVYVYGEHGREDAPADPFDPLAAHGVALDALVEQVARPNKGHPCDVHFGAQVVEVLAAAEQSLSTGRVVRTERGALRP
jgi:predicted dehydrogenase